MKNKHAYHHNYLNRYLKIGLINNKYRLVSLYDYIADTCNPMRTIMFEVSIAGNYRCVQRNKKKKKKLSRYDWIWSVINSPRWKLEPKSPTDKHNGIRDI